MKLIYQCIIIFFSIALFSSELSAKSFVWKVSDGEQHLYIGGTAHLLPASEFPLPPEFDQAYRQSEKLVFEVDMNRMAEPSINSMFMSFAKYQDGRTLNSVLSLENYQRLQHTAAEHEVDINTMASFKPDYVILNMMRHKLTQLGMAGEGVDRYFLNKGIEEDKSKVYLETIEQHLAIMLSVSDGIEDEWVARSLDQLDNIEQFTQHALEAWRSGNRAAFNELACEMLDTEVGRVEYQLMLTDRNRDWVEQIDAMLKTPEIEFVLVGAMHLAGPGNVLDLLAERGYQVLQLNAQ